MKRDGQSQQKEQLSSQAFENPFDMKAFSSEGALHLGSTIASSSSSSKPASFDYFLEFPDEYELGDGVEFDLDGIVSLVPGSIPLLYQPLPLLELFSSSSSSSSSGSSPSTTITGAIAPWFYSQQHQAPESQHHQVKQEPLELLGFSTTGSPGCSQATPSVSSPSAAGIDVQQDQKTINVQTERRNAAEAVEREKRVRLSGYKSGKNRLKTKFFEFGNPGQLRQAFGRKRGIIPDGLHGTNEVYNEQWEFEVRHRSGALYGEDNTPVMCIEWKITNCASKQVTSRTETPSDAYLRQTQGKTICNHVVREALDGRARELEDSIFLVSDNPLRVANLLSRAKALQPKRCFIGLLFFGLLHDEVQDRMYQHFPAEDGRYMMHEDDGQGLDEQEDDDLQ
jgi:hypothetical protein